MHWVSKFCHLKLAPVMKFFIVQLGDPFKYTGVAHVYKREFGEHIKVRMCK